MAKDFLHISKGLSLTPQTSDPASLIDGDMYYNSTTGKFRQKAGGVVGDLGGARMPCAHMPC